MLVSVVPVLAKRCPNFVFVPCALEFPFVASVPALPLEALEPLLVALASTKMLPGITAVDPSGNVTVAVPSFPTSTDRKSVV